MCTISVVFAHLKKFERKNYYFKVIELSHRKKAATTVNNACLLAILVTNFPLSLKKKTSHYIHTLPLHVIEKLIIYHKVLKFRLVRIFFILNYDIYLMIFLFLFSYMLCNNLIELFQFT